MLKRRFFRRNILFNRYICKNSANCKICSRYYDEDPIDTKLDKIKKMFSNIFSICCS